MIFEVRQYSVPKMSTKYQVCVPSDEVLLEMQKAGCKFYIDGKLYQPKHSIKRTKKIKEEKSK